MLWPFRNAVFGRIRVSALVTLFVAGTADSYFELRRQSESIIA